ncbi:MAG: GlsB/YeaQ/YmgE family stress response membrane protein [Magnetococcales bacterium]|nr:GlsB/YeaQ/YmgE family stress response membrane protein [Magnetococcales bacterium]
MSILLWVVLGLVAGFIASRIVNGTGRDVALNIVIGIVGAVFGGWLFNAFGMAGVVGFDLYSLLVAVVGAVVLLVIYHAVFRRGPLVSA